MEFCPVVCDEVDEHFCVGVNGSLPSLVLVGRPVEVHERDDVGESVVNGERGVGHDVGHVGGGQHLHHASDADVVGIAVYAGEDVSVHPSEHERLPRSRRVHEGEVLSVETQVHFGQADVCHVEPSAECERVASHAEDLVVVEYDSAVVEKDGLVLESEVERVNVGDGVDAVGHQLACDDVVVASAADMEPSCEGASEHEQLVGDERRGHGQGELVELDVGFDASFSCRVVLAVYSQGHGVSAGDVGPDDVYAVTLRLV